MEEIVIRKYRKDDRNFVRAIAYNTAFLGKPAGIFFDDKELLADFLTLYFTDYEGESCFVAETGGKVIGYLLGSKNIKKLISTTRRKILFRLLKNAVLGGAVSRRKNFVFMMNWFLSFLKGEFKIPDFSSEYPATLHINFEENFRNLGIGTKLISAYIDYLKTHGIRGVSFSTISEMAGNFFEKNGFITLYKSPRSYFRYLLNKDIFVCIYGKKL